MRASLGFDELHVDAHASTGALHAAFEHVADVEFAPDLRHIAGLAFVGEGRVAGDDEGAGNAREVGRQTLRYAVDEIFLLRIAADVGEGQDNHGEARGTGTVRLRGGVRIGQLYDLRRPEAKRVESVAFAGHGDDQSRLLRIGLDLST